MAIQMYRTTIDLAESYMDALAALAKKRGTSRATIIRDAIATEKYLQDAIDAGGKVLIERRDKTVLRVFIE